MGDSAWLTTSGAPVIDHGEVTVRRDPPDPMRTTTESAERMAVPVAGRLQPRRDRIADMVHTRTSPTRTPLRRLVGFEFELNVPVSGKGFSVEGAPDEMDPTYKFVTGPGLKEKTLIKDVGYGTGGYKIVVDHGPISAQVDAFKALYGKDDHVGTELDTEWETGRLEYVTAALDESAPNAAQNFRDQLTPVQVSMQGLVAADPAARSLKPAKGFQVGIEADLRPPIIDGAPAQSQAWTEARTAMRTGVHFRSYMQATAGIRLDALPRLHAEPAGAYVDLPHHVRVSQEMAQLARPILDATCNLAPLTPEHNGVLRGWVSQIVQYLIGDILWQIAPEDQSTEKNIAAFWSKMDLAVARTQLPQEVQTYIKTNTVQMYAALNTFRQQVGQRWSNNPIKRAAPIDLPVEFIRRALTEPTDGFSEPALAALDTLPGGRRGLPLEFRSLQAHPEPGQIIAAALQVVQKVQNTNQAL